MMTSKAIKTIFPFRWLLACGATLLLACENMVQYIDIAPSGEEEVKLAVSATIDTEGNFFLSFTEGRSLSAYRDRKLENDAIVRRGKVTLYDETDGRDVYVIDSSANGGFDLSLRSSGNSGYTATVAGLQLNAGHTYRLTLKIEGYPEATAVVAMPDMPIIEQALPDLRQTKHYSAYLVEAFNPNTLKVRAIDCYPVALRLTDNSPERDYYMVYLQSEMRHPGRPPISGVPYVAISDIAVIQDNPDVEASGLSMDSEFDALIFERILLSDMSFANATGAINLLVDEDVFMQNDGRAGEPPCDENSRSSVATFLCVAHLTPLSYAYYRSLSLQKTGLGFFSEPVSIPSNIENGYGCFSAISVACKSLAEYKACSGYYGLAGF
ncbi:MAG: DUF4249 domain-containing protein [Prevotellaceae bacterium]|jgi:hypothetical protein|nr:DUF4249 domain-containing protein [Prevotellaceae bacterium]